jgi:hypothetical protein
VKGMLSFHILYDLSKHKVVSSALDVTMRQEENGAHAAVAWEREFTWEHLCWNEVKYMKGLMETGCIFLEVLGGN